MKKILDYVVAVGAVIGLYFLVFGIIEEDPFVAGFLIFLVAIPILLLTGLFVLIRSLIESRTTPKDIRRPMSKTFKVTIWTTSSLVLVLILLIIISFYG